MSRSIALQRQEATGLRIATIASQTADGTARLVRHFAVGNRTLCRVELAGTTVAAPDPCAPAVDCKTCRGKGGA